MCECDDFKSYKEYKKENSEKIGYFPNIMSDEDCINCYNISIYGISTPDISVIEKRIKKRYNVECTCGFYYSYQDFLEKRDTKGAIAALMPKNNCYNCYLIKCYGTSNPNKVKEIKKTNILKKIDLRKNKSQLF